MGVNALGRDLGINKFELASAPLAAKHDAPAHTAALLSIIDTLEKLHGTGTKIHSAQSAYLVRLQAHLSENQKLLLKERAEIDAKSHTSGVWDMLATIGAYILAAIHTVTGSFLIEQGSQVVGGIMIGAGLISIANLAASNCGFWEWLANQIAGDNHELAMQLSTAFPAAFGLASAALGFVGTGQAMALVGEIDFVRQILLVAQTAVTFTEGVTSIGKGVSDYGVLTSQANLQGFQKEVAKNEHAMERLMLEMEQVVKTLEESTSSAARMIKFSKFSSQKALKI